MLADPGFYPVLSTQKFYPYARGGVITGLRNNGEYERADNFGAFLIGKMLSLTESTDPKNFMFENPPKETAIEKDQADTLRANASRFK